MSVHALLGLPEKEKRVVSLCGAGGKTTLLFALAEEARLNAATAVFTTTHIYQPEETDALRLPVPFSEVECRRCWAEGKTVAAGVPLPETGKLGPPAEEVMAFLCREGEAVFVEADGSRRMPLKYPAAWEPALRPETTHVVVVAGLSALGQPPEETIHRLALARETLEIPAGPVTEETIARLLWAGYGRFDPVFLLNQADDPERSARGGRIAELLRSLGARRAVPASLRAFAEEKGRP